MESKKEYKRALGLRIYKIRDTLGLSRDAFSELCGISSCFLCDIEGGKKAPSAQNLAKISKRIGISADYLVKGKSETDHSEIADMMIELINALEPEQRQFTYQLLQAHINALNSVKSSIE